MMKKNILLLLLLMAGICVGQALGERSEVVSLRAGELKVGVGKADITPPIEMLPFHPEHEAYPYVGIHDSLYARAIVMDNGYKRAVFVELDEVAVPDDQTLCAGVAREADVALNDVVVCVSHTHSTLHPNSKDKRLRPVIDRIRLQTIKAVRLALNSLQPATVAFASTKAYVNVNNGEIVKSKGQYYEDGFSDKTLDIIRFCKTDKTPLALILNYGTHAEVMFRSLTRENGYEITGDLPGRVAFLLEHAGESSPVVLTTAGAEADQQPLFTSKQRTATNGVVDQGAGGWAVMDVLARRLIDAVNETTRSMPYGDHHVELTTAFGKAVVPGQRLVEDHRTGEVNAKDMPPVAIPIAQIRLNDIAINAIGADLASALGAEIQKALPYSNAMLVTMMGGSVGYVLTDEAYRNAVHGVFGSRVKPGYAKDAIINRLKTMSDK